MATVSIRTSQDTAQTRDTRHPVYLDRIGQVLLIGILVYGVLAVVWFSWSWPLVHDAPLMQYCAFLIDHGQVPYKDIIDLNGIGAYFSSLLEIHLFGYSDFGWRLYDLLFLLLGSAGISLICRPFGWLAAIMGSCLFIMQHISLGIREVGQRDFQMAALELLSAGFLLQGFRDGKWGWFLASGATACLGASIKPAGFLFVALFLLLAIVLSVRGESRRLAQPFWMICGVALPCLLGAGYLLWRGAWLSFIQIFSDFVPLYARMARQPSWVLWGVLESHLRPILLLIVTSGLLVVCKPRNWFAKESLTVLPGVVCGLACYWIQAKGFEYHLEPLLAFLAAWCGMALGRIMHEDRALVRLPLALALAFWVVVWMPALVRFTRISTVDARLHRLHRLEAEITNFRSAGKDHGIQVMDTSSGAVHALYDLKLVQATGFIYDCWSYPFPDNRFVRGVRSRFLHEMAAARPDLLVVSNQSWPDPSLSYKRLDQWQELEAFMGPNYDLRVEVPGYRIYVHH